MLHKTPPQTNELNWITEYLLVLVQALLYFS